jgi:hypothetical protein
MYRLYINRKLNFFLKNYMEILNFFIKNTLLINIL